MGVFSIVIAVFVSLLAWPSPLFAYSLGAGKIVVASDRPIPVAGGNKLIDDCQKLIERSPLNAHDQQYKIYITNTKWRNRLFFAANPNAGGISYAALVRNVFLSGADFATGQLIHDGYTIQPPRTLAYYCAHELTHVVIGEHLGSINFLQLPFWVGEGLPDYVGIENRETFEQLDAKLGDKPYDLDMMQNYGVYAPYRLLVTYFLEKRGWSVERLLQSRISYEEAKKLMRSGKG